MVQVYNTSETESINVTGLDDDLYGDVFSKGTCVRPQRSVVLATRDYFVCSFTEQVTGQPGDVITDIVTAVADSPDGALVVDDTADVIIIDVPSAIAVQKVAAPPELPEPGGTFQFIVEVQNVSPLDALTIDEITDNVYGDVTTIPGSTCVVPQVLAPGDSYRCAFPGEVTGTAGDTHVDLVTVSGTDEDGQAVSGEDPAEVIITDPESVIEVVKTALPSEIPESGAPVTFDVTVVNLSPAETVTIDALVDDPFGDVSAIADGPCPLPQTLLPGESFSCSFTQALPGGVAGDTFVDTVTASGTDEGGDVVSDTDSAVVTVVPAPPAAPEIRVTKVAYPTTLEEPGGPVLYAVVTENRSQTDAVRVESIEDDIYGDVSDPGNAQVEIVRGCFTGTAQAELQPGGVALCLFIAEAEGVAGDRVVDTVTVTACVLAGEDCSATVLQDEDMASVDITRGPSTIEVFKTARPTVVPEPGGPVRFTVEVVNTSVSARITLASLVDDLYGDITQPGPDITETNCALPQELAAGGTYSCTFVAQVKGLNGDRITNIVSAAGTDDRFPARVVTAQDDARVSILASPPSIAVTKTPSPAVVAVPGGLVTFSVTVENTSAAATVEITTLSDDVYGNLDGLGDCAVPQTLAPGQAYGCRFPGEVIGDEPGEHENTVTASGATSDNRSVGDQASAIVQLRAMAPAIDVPVGSLWMLLLASLGVLAAAARHLGRRGRGEGVS